MMIDALSISSSALQANQVWLDQISNNIANMQTPGFKKAQTHFVDMVHQTTSANSGGSGACVNSLGAGTRVVSMSTVFTDGPVKATNNPLDLAIQGNGFIELVMPSGELAYTRVGALQIDSDGRLQTRSGLMLSSDIRIPPDVTGIEISQTGHIVGHVTNSANSVDLGDLMLAHFGNADALKPLGGGLYQATPASSDAQLSKAGDTGTGTLQQGFLEMSNVDMVEEMTGMVLAQRAYQLNSRILQASDQILETINNLRR